MKTVNNIFAKIGNPPCVSQCLKHLNHLCISAGLFNLFLSRLGECRSLDELLSRRCREFSRRHKLLTSPAFMSSSTVTVEPFSKHSRSDTRHSKFLSENIGKAAFGKAPVYAPPPSNLTHAAAAAGHDPYGLCRRSWFCPNRFLCPCAWLS